MKRLYTVIMFIMILGVANAQVSVEAQIDSMEMFIGEQVHVTIKALMNEKSVIEFPHYETSEMLIPGVEVLNRTEQETVDRDGGYVEKSVTYTLTSFDDTLYYLPPFVVKIDNKDYETKSLALKVLNIEVDTANVNQYFGPKDVQDNPFLWEDWSAIFWLSVLMLILFALDCYLYLRLRDNKPIISSISFVKKLLPHQKALKEIEIIKAEKLAQNEDSKEYYTKLTDTIRLYINERYGFNAMEMTSPEIIEKLDSVLSSSDLESAEQMKAELRQLFTTADLVKFAKYSTLINENDANLVSAIDFINQTKVENQESDALEKPQISEEEIRSNKTRLTLKCFIVGFVVVSVMILVYVIYTIYQLLN